MAKDKDEKRTDTCPVCGKNHRPGGVLTKEAQAAFHRDNG